MTDELTVIAGNYNENGYYFPIDAMSVERALVYRSQFEAAEREYKDKDPDFDALVFGHANMVMPFVDEITRLSSVLDPVRAILGPDVMVWGANLFIKEARSNGYVRWHQDLTYWGLDGEELVTAWVALSEVKTENGCMKMFPGSHREGKYEHQDTFGENNILHRGQELSIKIDEEQTISVELQPGQVSSHHGWVAHASHPNTTNDRRIGLSLQYLTPRTQQKHTDLESATLVRGKDRYGNFRPEPLCTENFAPEMITFQAEVERLKHKVYDTK